MNLKEIFYRNGIFAMRIYAAVFLTVLASCGNPEDSRPSELRIAFGSCDNQLLPQVMWESILHTGPDVWIWSGDVIYMDSGDSAITAEAYRKQFDEPGYKLLRDSAIIIGTWDDHDYGLNDGGKEWEFKEQKKRMFLDFLEEPDGSKRRMHPGVYSAQDFVLKGGMKIKVILLDGRYFRDSLTHSSDPAKRYDPNPYGQGTFLGETQWKWLEEELKNSDAVLNIIVSGVQLLSEEHGFEGWYNFPHEQDRLYDLLKSSGAQNVLFLSGDRHIAEISKTTIPGLDYPLYDVTSSGLTHSFEGADEPNKYRVSPLIDQKNFGLLIIKPVKKKLWVEADLMGENDTIFYSETIKYNISDR